MDPVDNPYSPGAGRKPAALVGRDETITAWQVAVQRAERGTVDQPIVLYGRRGVGKTVLLDELASIATAAGWIVGEVEASSDKDLRRLLGDALYEPLVDLVAPTMSARLVGAIKTAASFFKGSYDAGTDRWTVGFEFADRADTTPPIAVAADLRAVVRDLSAVAQEQERGLAILIDEAQDLSGADIAELAAVAQYATKKGWPFLVALAGLPNLPGVLATAKSYTERYVYHPIEELEGQAARDALTRPALETRVTWEDAALEAVITASGRFPYFLQQYGQDTWHAALGPDVITAKDAENGIRTGTLQLDAGFFRARWDRATKGERDYLSAIAADGDISTTSAVAERLGKTTQQLGPTRANLIAKGLVFAPDHGDIAFTVPGMAAFIARQRD